MEQWERDMDALKSALREVSWLEKHYSSLSKEACVKFSKDIVEAKLEGLLCSINSSPFGSDMEFRLYSSKTETKCQNT